MTRVTGHALFAGGDRTTYARGKSDRARCTCGARSPAGIGVAAARRWHTQHKTDVVAGQSPTPLDQLGRRSPATTTDATLDALPIPDEGRVLLVLSIPESLDDADGHVEIAEQLQVIGEDIAPGRVSVVVLGAGIKFEMLTDEDLAALGLARVEPT